MTIRSRGLWLTYTVAGGVLAIASAIGWLTAPYGFVRP